MSILICSIKHGGCGFIGQGSDWKSLPEVPGDDDMDDLGCPQCGEDHAFEITEENLERLTYDRNRELARKLLNNDPSVVGKAKCGCHYHAEEGIACEHDIALAREQQLQSA